MSTFTSNFAPHIEAMLEWRTSLGHSLRDMRNAMTGFDRFCSSHHPGETVLTRELATAWCRDTATGTWGAYRSRAVREFGKYLQLAGVDAFIVPSGWIASPTRGLPHMFTDEELAAFFRAADSIDAEYRSPVETASKTIAESLFPQGVSVSIPSRRRPVSSRVKHGSARTRRGAACASRPSMRTSLIPAALRKAKNLFSDHTTFPVPAIRLGATSTMNPRTSSTVTAPREPRPARSR